MSKINVPEEYIERYGGQGSCEYNSICDYSYASDICHLQRGYDCPECPKRKALREEMKKDVANDPELKKRIAERDKRNEERNKKK